jgi:hypothetical protein
MVIYCKTDDSSRKVGELICRANSSEGSEWKIQDEVEADSWTIETSCRALAHALVYRVGATVVAVEIEVDCASNVIEPLIENYGFENIKWLIHSKYSAR